MTNIYLTDETEGQNDDSKNIAKVFITQFMRY